MEVRGIAVVCHSDNREGQRWTECSDSLMVKLYTVPLCVPITHIYTYSIHTHTHTHTHTHIHAATAPHQATHSFSPLSFSFSLHLFLSSPSIPTFNTCSLSPNSPEGLRAWSHSTCSSCDLIHPLPYIHCTVTLSWSHYYMEVKGPLEGALWVTTDPASPDSLDMLHCRLVQATERFKRPC